jgi:glycerol-3-phosphate dehydrogenase
VAKEVAELLAPELGWSSEQTEREIEYYRKRVEAERVSQAQEGDHEADATRRGAPDIVPTT